ncbi:uncharacterized protein LOC144162556 isoform X1 [Haemaphysalis longicornis]
MYSPRPCTGRNQDVSHRSSMMVFLGVVAAFLFACIAGTRCTSIDCQETGETLYLNRRCEYEQECHVHCKSACLTDSRTRVYGTGDYFIQSSICKSALHDLRISSWNSSAWNVSLRLFEHHYLFERFRGSMRYGVTSDDPLVYSRDRFQFTSPRIKEEVLDITALHRDFIYNDNIASKLECHGPSDRNISFGYSIKETNFTNIDQHSKLINGTYFLSLSTDELPLTRTNMFWCLVERSTLSNVGSPAMFYGPEVNPGFLPQKYTVTASLHDSVTLRVQALPGKSANPRVRFWARVNSTGDASTLTTQTDPSPWNIPTVDLHHSGVYIAQGPGDAPGKRRGVFRVIVRTCPHGIYGPSCNLKCPVCQNGGVCHDITGACICPPGFQGETCEKPCGDDYFGRECQHRCSDTNQDKNVKSCRGILMCLPDPYGCSCGTGFHGPFCNETCPPNFYGADCKQSRFCFCKTEQVCDIYTGTCSQDNGTCLQGWKNAPYCDTSYPLLKDKPLVSGISEKTAIIRFSAWTKNRDDGEGQPKEYRIEFKVANKTWSTQTVTAFPKKDVYDHTLTGLRSGTDYQVRVLVMDADGNYRERDAVVAMFRTACGSPKMAPQNVTIDNSTTSEIVVKWKNPGREKWSCWSVSVILEVDGVYGENKEFNLTQFGSTFVEEYRISVKPYTRVGIRLRLRTPNDKYSPWTQKYNVTSAEDANSSSNGADVGGIIGGVAVIMILIIVAVSLTRYHLRKKAAVANKSDIPRMQALKENVTKLSKLKENSMSESQNTLIIDTGEYLPMASIRNGGLPSKPVLVKCLRKHVLQAEAEGNLKEEYMNLPKGQLHSWDIAMEQENKSKNRDGCKLPYDHSRVILAPSPPGDSTDYINASYVRGYKISRKYIATQGPKESTLADFWRMVWQEGSYKIVMLTNLMEQEKTKCSQYWPETSKTYCNFTVTLMKTDAQVDFVVREFQVTLDDNTRRVVQFHFTAWPDHGVPLHPAAFRAFLGRIRDFLPGDEHPIIVHCSDGIGRTGAFVLVDSMLTQAEAEGRVDLVAQLYAMRQTRVDLVDSLEQYIFAYNILVEILCPKNHKLSIEEFVRLHPKLKAKFPASGKSLINLEFEELSSICASPVPESFRSARDANNTCKDRSSKILAGDSRRPLLRVTSDGLKTDCINAVYVDGYKRSKAYLVTQMPLLETIDDFWEMLVGSGAVTLVTLGPLEDEAVTPIFWPDLKCAAAYGDVTVEQNSTQDFQGLVVRTFLLTQSSGPPRILKQFHSQSWPTHPSVPSSAKVVLELLEHVQRWQAQADGTPVVVQCLDGRQHSGLYCVSAAICDQLQLEKELDVFRAVQNVRGSRAEFIVDSEQYAFCYEVALACVDSLHMYSSIE